MYQMNTRPDTWPNPTSIEQATERYNQSDRATQDALDWAGDHAHRHPQLVDLIVDYYLESPEAAAMIEDIADGEVPL